MLRNEDPERRRWRSLEDDDHKNSGNSDQQVLRNSSTLVQTFFSYLWREKADEIDVLEQGETIHNPPPHSRSSNDAHPRDPNRTKLLMSILLCSLLLYGLIWIMSSVVGKVTLYPGLWTL
jgi:hypothetical protein